MSARINARNNADNANASAAVATKDLLTIIVGEQLFGLPILQVQDVLGPQKITRIPLAPPEISGALNLRGRIVTAINLRDKLGMPPRDAELKYMSVVVEHDGELFSLMIDKVGDVMSLSDADYEKNPATLDAGWRDISAGVYRLEKQILVTLDVPKLLDSIRV